MESIKLVLFPLHPIQKVKRLVEHCWLISDQSGGRQWDRQSVLLYARVEWAGRGAVENCCNCFNVWERVCVWGGGCLPSVRLIAFFHSTNTSTYLFTNRCKLCSMDWITICSHSNSGRNRISTVCVYHYAGAIVFESFQDYLMRS